MKTVLITGSDGQLGSSLRTIVEKKSLQKAEKKIFIYTDFKDLDITNENNINQYFEKYDIDTVVNCAAYTQVDKAEEDLLLAQKINETGVQLLAEACENYNCKLIHISTDFVFNGKKGTPYKTSDPTQPLGAYGRTKLAGEVAALKHNKNTIIIRTSWLYSNFGHNFVKTMLRLGASRDNLNVVYDQIGSPTYAIDLAAAIYQIIEQPFKPEQWGQIYHYANQDITSWYDFTVAIMELANLDCKINPIESKDYPTPAQRPVYSVLHTQKIKEAFQLEIPHWRISLKACLQILKDKN